jgi:hypothetical protein
MARSTADRLADYQRRYRNLAPQLHGPYWQWTAKVNGKTVNRRLTQREAELYQEWIDNDRRQRAIIAKMREVAATATALLLKENPRPEP